MSSIKYVYNIYIYKIYFFKLKIYLFILRKREHAEERGAEGEENREKQTSH